MRKRYFLILLVAVGILIFWQFGYQYALRCFFRISGTVSLSPAAIPPLPSNTMLLLVAKNKTGVPVAIKKIINPIFPTKFEITSSNLIMPDILTRHIFIEAYFNAHGQIKNLSRNDLYGDKKMPLNIRTKGVKLQLENFVK